MASFRVLSKGVRSHHTSEPSPRVEPVVTGTAKAGDIP